MGIKKVLYIDCSILNDEPVRKTIEHEGRKINVFYINHGISLVYIIKENKLDLILEDSHDTIAGQHAIDFLKSKLNFKGKHYRVDIDKIEHIEEYTKIEEGRLRSLNALVEKIKRLCEEDEDIITINSGVLKTIPYMRSQYYRILHEYTDSVLNT